MSVWLGSAWVGAWIGLGVVVMAVAAAFHDDESGIRTWWALRADLLEAETRIEKLRVEVDTVERDSGGLEADPFALERAIRERLQFARPGETLIRLVPTDAANHWIP